MPLATEVETRPLALDLFCCQGGATKGLQRAGFHVTGVDRKPQPRYCGNAFHQGDALAYPVEGFDFIWASPPCQPFSALRHMPTARNDHEDLIEPTRARLIASGVPYCIENVDGAPLGNSGYLIMLCGSMFGLQTADGRAELRRHRLFETSFSIPLRPACQHGMIPLGVYGGHVRDRCRNVLTVVGHTPVDNRRHAITVTGTGMGPRVSKGRERPSICVTGAGLPLSGAMHTGRPRAITVTGNTPQANLERNRVRETFTTQQAREAMGIDWMSMAGLSQAIPPAYSLFIAEQFLASYSPIYQPEEKNLESRKEGL